MTPRSPVLALTLALVACSRPAGTTTSAAASTEPRAAAASAPPQVALGHDPPPTASVSGAASETAPAPEAGPDLVFVPMTLRMDPLVVELRRNGTVAIRDKVIAQFVRNELRTLDGKHVALVAKDGRLYVDGENADEARFDAKGALVSGKLKKGIWISDDGRVSVEVDDGRILTDVLTTTGFKPEARRAALLAYTIGAMVDAESAPAFADPSTRPE